MYFILLPTYPHWQSVVCLVVCLEACHCCHHVCPPSDWDVLPAWQDCHCSDWTSQPLESGLELKSRRKRLWMCGVVSEFQYIGCSVNLWQRHSKWFLELVCTCFWFTHINQTIIHVYTKGGSLVFVTFWLRMGSHELRHWNFCRNSQKWLWDFFDKDLGLLTNYYDTFRVTHAQYELQGCVLRLGGVHKTLIVSVAETSVSKLLNC